MNKIKLIFSKYQKIIYFIVFVLFIGLELFFSPFHEPFADEAQSWLIARDSSFIDILKYIKYEGTPPLWIFVIKIFMIFKLKYNLFYIIPLLSTSIGIYLLLFKSDFPWYVKLLFPFTYTIFYQLTIVCRSYCLIFPLLMIIYLNYKNRFNHPIRYSIILIIFMNISLHTYFIAGSLFAIYLYDYYKLRKQQNEHNINNKNIIISFILIFIGFIVDLIIIFPDQYMGCVGTISYNLFEIFGEATFSNGNLILSIIITITLAIIILKNNSLENIIKIIIIFLPLLAIFLTVTCLSHHLSIVYLLVFFILMINYKDLLSKLFIIILLVFQIYWNFNTVQFDYNNDYDGGYKVANFLEDLDYKNKTIYGVNFHIVSVQPYFEKNIYNNYGKNSDKAYYIWSIAHDYDETLDTLPDICIIPVIAGNTISNGKFKTITQNATEILEKNNYICYSFPGYHYYKFGIGEIDNLLVFVSPEINEEVDHSKYTEYSIPSTYYITQEDTE